MIRNNHDLFYRKDFYNIERRVEIVEHTNKSFESKFREIYLKCEKFDRECKTLSDFKADRKDLDDLANKMNVFIKEFGEGLKNRVETLENTSKSFEVKFREIYVKCEHFDKETKRLSDDKADRKDLKALTDKINALIKEVEEALKWKQPVVTITNKIDNIEIQIQQILNGFGKKVDNGGNNKDLEGKLRLLTNDFEKFKEDVMGWLKDLQDALEIKVDWTSFNDLKIEIYARFDDLNKKFADKSKTDKAIKEIERQLKILYEMIMNMNVGGNKSDAMFAKKPLGGWSCASCATDLVNLQGVPADYVPWSKWPLRDPNEKLSKSGNGFSRILANSKPEHMPHPNFYPNGTADGYQETIQPSDKFTIKKKKRSRPMSASRPGQLR